MKPGVHLERRGRVVRALRHHRADDRELVDALRQVRQEAADPLAALAVAAEREGTLHQPARPAEEGLDLPLARQLPPVVPRQVGLVVEGVDVADAAACEDLDDPLRPRREMQDRLAGGPGLLAQHPGQRDGAEARPGIAQEVPAASRERTFLSFLSILPDIQELARVEQGPCQLVQAGLAHQVGGPPAFGDGRRACRARGDRSDRPATAVSGPRFRPHAVGQARAWRRTNESFIRPRAWSGVVVTARFGALTDGSGQSSVSRSGSFAELMLIR